jgi:hypothetical protein
LLDWRYIRNKITVNRGTVRVKDLVIWDGAGYPLPDTAADGALGTPADIKFLGVDVRGQFANTCVVEVPDTDIVDIESPDHPELDGAFRSVRRRNQRAQSNTTDILITNYEYQRERPVPWGLDYQWLFAAARYGTADLDPAELERFDDMGRRYAPGLHKADRDSLLPTNNGRPFPYIVSAGSPARSALTDIDSRPVCIPGDDNGDG